MSILQTAMSALTLRERQHLTSRTASVSCHSLSRLSSWCGLSTLVFLEACGGVSDKPAHKSTVEVEHCKLSRTGERLNPLVLALPPFADASFSPSDRSRPSLRACGARRCDRDRSMTSVEFSIACRIVFCHCESLSRTFYSPREALCRISLS